MAEVALFRVVGEMVKNLGSKAFGEIGSWWGLKEELEKLENTVSAIQAVLLDAEEEKKQNNQFKDWFKKLKNAVYDADDILDDFYTEASRQGVMTGYEKVGVFFSSSNQFVYGVEISHKIKAIRERLDMIAQDRLKFQYIERPVEKHVESMERRQTDSLVFEEAIGRDDDVKEIIKWLLESNVKENVSVIPIVGIGGLGKTTLAQLALNDENVKAHFELIMWVCVSDDFDEQVIVRKILESASKKKLDKVEMDTWQSELRKEIDGKKYLLVLDDVWNEDQVKWQRLRSLLMGGARGSKIVITTRTKLVAEITGTVSPFHLEGLSDDESWSLLKKTAFKVQGQESSNSQLEKIGREIAKKCVGVPLAVKTLGRVLYFKTTELEWSNVLNNELATITQQENDILPILKLSYDHLPSHLKYCFAYCSLFPKDYEIDKKTLVNLWVAQGYIQSSTRDQQLEDAGHEYFMDLVWRSFFQEVQEDGVGNVISCKMHDLMHDLASSVAGIECTLVNLGMGNVDKRARHVSFGYGLDSSWKIPTALLEENKVRTFLLPAQSYDVELKMFDCNTIVSTCKCLRALDFHGSNIKEVPCSIGELKHSRYLDLSKNKIKKLPSSISRLHNLHTLKLSDCGKLVELPRDIRNMVNLTHLMIDGCSDLIGMPKGLGQLTCLQTLPLFVVGKPGKGSSGLRELNGLNNLRGELEIKQLENVKSAEFRDANCLKKKQYLQSLKLEWSSEGRSKMDPCTDDEVVLEALQPHPNLNQLSVRGFAGVRFSYWLSSLTNIVEIRLQGYRMCQHLPLLDQLPSLKILSLRELVGLEYITSEETSTSRTTTTFFPSLKKLYLLFCPRLKGWWKNNDGSSDSTTTTSMAELPSFPCLSILEIWYCPNLTSMPLYPSLEEHLDLDDTSLKPFQQTMKMKMEMMTTSAAPSTSSSSSSSYPLSRLKYLSIAHIYELESLPQEELQNLTFLQSLTIKLCPRLMSLPGEGFRGLTSLRSLKISHCNGLKSLSGVFQHLTALEELEIQYCSDFDLSSDGMQWQYLKSLSSLSIGGFTQMVSLFEGFQHLTTLEKLNIEGCKELDLSDAGIRFKESQSLRILRLQSIPKLGFLSKGLQHLTALEELHISECENLDLSDAGIRFKDSQSLRILGLESIPNLVSLPDWLQHVTTLQRFDICNCPNFMTWPEWIGNLTSLQKLYIYNCPKLTPLPQGMIGLTALTALQDLEIAKCPKLSKRCSNNMGEDWPNIAHIPNITIDYQLIQFRGRYQLRNRGILQCFHSGQ